MSNGLRVYFQEAGGWLIETPIGLTQSQVIAAVKWARKNFAAQALAYGPGDRRDAIERNLQTLTPQTVQQKLISRYPWERDRIVKG